MSQSEGPVEPPAPEAPRRSRTLHRLRNYFLTGLIIAAPLFLTVYLTWAFVVWIDSWVTPVIPERYNPNTYLPFEIPGFGLIVAILFLTLLGFLTANFVGRKLVSWGEYILGRMPIVRNLHGGLKQIFETVLSSRAKSFQTVGLIEYPRKGLWALVFIASKTRGEVSHKLDVADDPMISVFLPTTPNPTSGFLLFVRESEVLRLDMSVEEGAKLVISAGLVTPEYELDDEGAPVGRRPKAVTAGGRRVGALPP
jgi:uncharacterized membrane protein